MINPTITPARRQDTDPQMASVSGLLCWYCSNPALKDTCCAACKVALCKDHRYTRQVKGKTVVVCPDHRGGAA